jgi:hypothetical protein
VNYPLGNGNFLIVGDRRYELTQFHFHHPSEKYIHGQPSAMRSSVSTSIPPGCCLATSATTPTPDRRPPRHARKA